MKNSGWNLSSNYGITVLLSLRLHWRSVARSGENEPYNLRNCSDSSFHRPPSQAEQCSFFHLTSVNGREPVFPTPHFQDKRPKRGKPCYNNKIILLSWSWYSLAVHPVLLTISCSPPNTCMWCPMTRSTSAVALNIMMQLKKSSSPFHFLPTVASPNDWK